jgi:hypothetical protein
VPDSTGDASWVSREFGLASSLVHSAPDSRSSQVAAPARGWAIFVR